LIALAEGVTQGSGGQAVLASDVQGHRVSTQHHRHHAGVARETTGFGGGQLPAGVEYGGAETVDEVGEFHGKDQVGALPAPRGQFTLVQKAAHGFDEGVGSAFRRTGLRVSGIPSMVGGGR
jgi:hypothetical protein